MSDYQHFHDLQSIMKEWAAFKRSLHSAQPGWDRREGYLESFVRSHRDRLDNMIREACNNAPMPPEWKAVQEPYIAQEHERLPAG